MKTNSCKKFLATIASLLFALWLAPPATAQDEIGELKYLEVKVLDPDGKPLPDATVEIAIDNVDFPMMTDEEGIIPLNVPGSGASLKLTVKEDGYVSLGIYWKKGEKIPDEFSIPVQKGTAIGGIVHDEQGNPVEGVIIEGYDSIDDYRATKAKLQPRLRGELATTDAKGRWQFKSAPTEPMQLQLKFSHPEFVDDDSYSFRGGTWEQLLTLKNIVVLEKGIELRGRVVGPDSQPIAGAKVAYGTGRYSSDRRTTETNAEGEYLFANLAKRNDRTKNLVVTSAEWAPDVQKVSLKKKMKPIDFKLQPGNKIRFHVTDKQGKPLPGVRVTPEYWRDQRVLERSPVETDAEGNWTWNGAPADEIKYSLYKDGYMSVSELPLKPSDQPHEITLGPQLVITGNVIDAETKKPIPSFFVVEGILWRETDNRVSWQRHRKEPGEGGSYRVSYRSPHVGYRIKIEAENYRPSLSEIIKSDAGNVTLDFELEAGVGPHGIIKSPDGIPLEGVSVSLATLEQQSQFQNGVAEDFSPVAKTKVDGSFTLPFPEGDYLVACSHDAGWAEVAGNDSGEPHEITLKPWAKVEGRFLKGDIPQVNQTIQMSSNKPYVRDQPRTYWSYNTKTNAEGVFRFDRAIAGSATLRHYFIYGGTANGDWRSANNGDWRSANAQSQQVELVAGQTTQVQLGGTGQNIKGKLVVPEGKENLVAWENGVVQIRSSSPNAGVKNAVQALGKKIAQLGQAKPQPRPRAIPKQYASPIESDGSYEVFDVEPGQYTLTVTIHGEVRDEFNRRNTIAALTQQITVAEGQETVDLGEQTLSVGDSPQ